MPSQNKLIKQGIYLTESLFDNIIKRLNHGVRTSDTLESFLTKTKDYTMNNPLVITGYKDDLLEIILKETNNHKFSRPAQKELTRLTIENRVGDLIVKVGDDIKQSVRDIVKHGYNNNLSQDEIAANITKKVKTIENTRAKTIARTEIARTATASDYVINRERGATHFKVDCRNDCCTVCEEDYHWGDKEYTINQIEMLPPRHPNCRCYAIFYKKERELERAYSRNLTSLNKVEDIAPEDIGVDPKKEFESISKKGFIRYVDEEGNNHDVPVRCKESSIIDFGDEKEIGKKLDSELCYQYDILDKMGNVRVTIFKSKNHNQFSMSQLIKVYDNLNKTLVNDCNEIILSNHSIDKSGGFVLESNPHRVHILRRTTMRYLRSVLIHEMAHSLDMSNGISRSSKYRGLVREYPYFYNSLYENEDHYFAEDFAYSIEALYNNELPLTGKSIYLYKLLGII